MKKILYSMCIFLFLFLPASVFAEGYISSSTTSLTIEQGSSKTFTISAYNAIGDVSISSNNSSIASVNISEWGTGMVDEKQTKTGSVTVYGVNVGTTTITLAFDAATFDNDDLSGQTKTISVTVTASTPVPTPTPTPTPTPSLGNPTPNTSTVQASKSADATLKNIKISSGVLNFDANVLSYDVTVGYDVEKIEINGELNDSKASLKLEGNTNLKLGVNTFKIKVTAEDGTTSKEYIINVNRIEKALSNNSKLKELNISNYNFKFSKNKTNYKLQISNEDSLTINATVDDKLSTYEVIGNKNLKNGSVIKIKVTAEDGSNTLYKINIVKGGKSNIGLILSLILNIILILVIMYIWYIGRTNNYNIWKSNKKKENSLLKEVTGISDADTNNNLNIQSSSESFNSEVTSQNQTINQNAFEQTTEINKVNDAPKNFNNYSSYNTQIDNSYFENQNNELNNKNY